MDIGDPRNITKAQSPESSKTNATPGLPGSGTPKLEIAKTSKGTSTPSAASDGPKESLTDLLIEFGCAEPAPSPKKMSSEERSRRWAALLMDRVGMESAPPELARTQFIDWLTHLAEGVLGIMPALPGIFQTTRFYNEIKTIESPLRFLKTVSENLRSGALTFYEAVNCVGRSFGWEEERLEKWKQGLENFAGFKRWLPSFMHAHEYLTAAFPMNNERLDKLRALLLQALDEPHRLLEPGARIDFDTKFLEFKKNYMDTYFLLHEDALHVMGGFQRDEVKVDPVALRNLELLSSLPHADQSFLNRVKLLARWIQHNQCNLPVDQILELYPRCYCNFNPAVRQHPSSSATQINTLLQEGLEYFRRVLRRCGNWILLEVKAQAADDESLKQINTLLGDGPLIPLKPSSTKLLKKIITRNSGEFLSEIRKARQ